MLNNLSNVLEIYSIVFQADANKALFWNLFDSLTVLQGFILRQIAPLVKRHLMIENFTFLGRFFTMQYPAGALVGTWSSAGLVLSLNLWS